MKTITKTFVATVLLALTSTVFADDGTSIKVGRDYKVTAQTGNITSVALGEQARSDVNIGGMQLEGANVSIGRDYNVTAKTGDVTAVALGKNVSARVNVGGIQQGSRP